jgi:hypothetical protein
MDGDADEVVSEVVALIGNYGRYLLPIGLVGLQHCRGHTFQIQCCSQQLSPDELFSSQFGILKYFK